MKSKKNLYFVTADVTILQFEFILHNIVVLNRLYGDWLFFIKRRYLC